MILNLLWCGGGDDYNDIKCIVVVVMVMVMIIVLNLLWWS